MNEQQLDATVKSIFQQVFDIPPDKLDDQTRRGALMRWDSLGHLTLLEALREEFRIEISPERALDIETIGDIKRLVAKKSTAGPAD